MRTYNRGGPRSTASRLVLGLKSHHGSRSTAGTQAAATFYSLVETAKLLGVEPVSVDYHLTVTCRPR